MKTEDLNALGDIELDLSNLLMSFGVTKEQAEEIDKMIDVTIENHLRFENGEQS